MCIRDRARNASTPPTPSRPARSSTSSTTSTAYCFSTGWPERTPSTPASATCSGRGAVVPTTLWYQQQHCGTNNTVVPNDDGGVAPVAQPAEAGVLNTLQLGFESLRGHCWGWLWTSRHTGTGLCVVLDTPARTAAAGCGRKGTPLTAMAILRSSNPAFTRGAGFGAPTPGVDELERMYAGSDRLTVDDVVMHTLGLFAVLGIAAGFGWMLTGGNTQHGEQAEGVHD